MAENKGQKLAESEEYFLESYLQLDFVTKSLKGEMLS